MSDLQSGIDEIIAAGRSKPAVSRDPVNQPMIHHWTDAIGDQNPIYVDENAAKAAGHDGIVAPPAMIQAWTMMGLGRSRSDDDPLARIMKLFDDAGYVGVVATNCDQTYHRYLRPGEHVAISAEITDVVGPKQTALGEGYFVNQKIRWHVVHEDGADEEVADMDWRIMKFLPANKRGQEAEEDSATGSFPADLDPDKLMRPSWSKDTQFFWDGVTAHELRIQRRPDGSLQHPPVPALWKNHTDPVTADDYVVASGKGTIFSYVVHHAPKVPGRSLPFVIALVELEEGVRMLGELRGVDHDKIKIGMPVAATFIDFPDSDVSPAWTLYAWEAAK